MALKLDTGPLLAAMDRSDRDHTACAQLLESTQEQLVIPAPILPELDYWFHKGMGPEALTGLLDEIAAGVFDVEDLRPADYRRVAELLEQYIDLQLIVGSAPSVSFPSKVFSVGSSDGGSATSGSRKAPGGLKASAGVAQSNPGSSRRRATIRMPTCSARVSESWTRVTVPIVSAAAVALTVGSAVDFAVSVAVSVSASLALSGTVTWTQTSAVSLGAMLAVLGSGAEQFESSTFADHVLATDSA